MSNASSWTELTKTLLIAVLTGLVGYWFSQIQTIQTEKRQDAKETVKKNEAATEQSKASLEEFIKTLQSLVFSIENDDEPTIATKLKGFSEKLERSEFDKATERHSKFGSPCFTNPLNDDLVSLKAHIAYFQFEMQAEKRNREPKQFSWTFRKAFLKTAAQLVISNAKARLSNFDNQECPYP